jgi:predicted SprT family Zn-dependent metalloprotease
MAMKKIEDVDRKDSYYRCEACHYETEPKKKSKENVGEPQPYCPRCGN